eukprot:CFRG6811T1
MTSVSVHVPLSLNEVREDGFLLGWVNESRTGNPGCRIHVCVASVISRAEFFSQKGINYAHPKWTIAGNDMRVLGRWITERSTECKHHLPTHTPNDLAVSQFWLILERCENSDTPVPRVLSISTKSFVHSHNCADKVTDQTPKSAVLIIYPNHDVENFLVTSASVLEFDKSLEQLYISILRSNTTTKITPELSRPHTSVQSYIHVDVLVQLSVARELTMAIAAGSTQRDGLPKALSSTFIARDARCDLRAYKHSQSYIDVRADRVSCNQVGDREDIRTHDGRKGRTERVIDRLDMVRLFACSVHSMLVTILRILHYTPYTRVPPLNVMFSSLALLSDRVRWLLVWPVVYINSQVGPGFESFDEYLGNDTEKDSSASSKTSTVDLCREKCDGATTAVKSERYDDNSGVTSAAQARIALCDNESGCERICRHRHGTMSLDGQYRSQGIRRCLRIALYDEILSASVDTVLGVVCGVVLFMHADIITSTLARFVRSWTVDQIIITVRWLSGSPGGIKLNPPVARFLGMVFEVYTGWWGGVLGAIEPHFHNIFKCLCIVFSPGGLSLLVSALVDMTLILTFHVYLMSLLAANLYGGTVRSLISTYRHFRGYKRNVLRLRIDSCRLEYDQLLVNTMFFTTFLFTIPTVTIFYAFFLFCSMITSGLVIATRLVCVTLLHLPVYAVWIRVWYPDYIPGGLLITPIVAPISNCTWGSTSNGMPDTKWTSRMEKNKPRKSECLLCTEGCRDNERATNPVGLNKAKNRNECGDTKTLSGTSCTTRASQNEHINATTLSVRNRRIGWSVLFERYMLSVRKVVMPYSMYNVLLLVAFGYEDVMYDNVSNTQSSPVAESEKMWMALADLGVYRRELLFGKQKI